MKCKLTQREEMERKPAELIITAALIFFHDSGFHSQVKLSTVNPFSNIEAQKLRWDRIVQGWANFSHKGPHCKNF